MAANSPQIELFIEFMLGSTLYVILTASLGWLWSKIYGWAPKLQPYLHIIKLLYFQVNLLILGDFFV